MAGIAEVQANGQTISTIKINRPKYDDIEPHYIKIHEYTDESVQRYYCKRFKLVHKDLYKECINGNANYQNTCALRMSYALNHGGFKISRKVPYREYINENTNDSIILKVPLMIEFLKSKFKKSDIEFKSDANSFKSQMQGTKGIVVFEIKYSDANGHVTLWNGSECIDGSDDDFFHPRLHNLHFWELK